MARLTIIFYSPSVQVSKRIKCITDLVSDNKSIIWDICCDHGIIGSQFLSSKEKVIFLDQVPSIMKNLELNIASDITNVEFKTESATLCNFKSPNNSCFIICGIGGELGIKILENLEKYLNHEQEIIISVHKNQVKFREYLIKKKYNLIDEYLIRDKNKFYEILKINLDKNTTVNEVKKFGSKMWSSTDDETKKAYLRQLIEFYQTKARYNDVYKAYLQDLANIAL